MKRLTKYEYIRKLDFTLEDGEIQIDELIQKLKEAKDKGADTIGISEHFNDYGDYEGYDIEFSYTRLETDKEFAERKKDEERRRKEQKEREERKIKAEKELLRNLLKKYGKNV